LRRVFFWAAAQGARAKDERADRMHRLHVVRSATTCGRGKTRRNRWPAAIWRRTAHAATGSDGDRPAQPVTQTAPLPRCTTARPRNSVTTSATRCPLHRVAAAAAARTCSACAHATPAHRRE